MNRLATYIASGLMAVAAASCSDDRLWNADDIIGNGEATISATVGFKTFEPALEKSRTAGNTLDGIDNITILAYDQKGEELIDSKVYTSADLTFTENKQNPADGVDVDNTVPTQKTTLEDFNLSYGRYKVYVVANADLTGEDVSSEAKLKALTFDWQSDISKNNQMFGWFEENTPDAISGNGLDAPVISINKSAMTLNAWLVRLGSKVTVSYDASDLNENVFIFLKSVQIKDIPVSCALGERNTPSESSELIADGEKILYYEGEEPTPASFNPDTYKATLTRSTKNFGSDHSHDADALFFYENNQGKGKNKGQDVVNNNTTGQTPGGEFNPGSGSSDGKIDFPNGNSSDENTGFKDEKRYGTYIEVKAYYRSNNEERMGEGDITYRFMLGKNITDSYEALRNYHYKLTLKFNKFANDVDWHIEYTPEPGIYAASPYYISYIYNKTMNLPVQITGIIKPGTTIRANIIENDWRPYDYAKQQYAPADQYYSEGSYNYNYTKDKVHNGFLSLRNTGDIRDIATTANKKIDLYGADAFNLDYWERTERGTREYDPTVGDNKGTEKDGLYSVTKPIDGSDEDIVLSIPLYTRAKNLVKQSGYTGNNPYVSFQRKAVVKFTATLWDPNENDWKDISTTADIIQVRRVVNPKGVWRAHNESGQFLVHLTRLETEFTTDPWKSTGEFKTFSSIGPWSAEVLVEGGYNTETNTPESANGWIQLSPYQGVSTRDGNTIHGETGSEIKFYYQPNGTINDKHVRYGIIKVRYHNYTCEHLVFVRQGYAPIPVATDADATKWYSFNMVTPSEIATSPLDEGSLFKRFDWYSPIRAINNCEEFPFQSAPGNRGLEVNYFNPEDKRETSPNGTQYYKRVWAWWDSPAGKNKWDDVTVDGKKMRVASVEDYLQLYNDENVQYGFGILYGDTNDSIQTLVKDAYSYYAPYKDSNGKQFDESKGANGQGRGMRGVFVYNERTGAQIFLPIGAAGYGRRRQNRYYTQGGPFSPGELIYGGRDKNMAGEAGLGWYRPILFDLYRRPGAIYWCYETYKNPDTNNYAIPNDDETENTVGWDFNYITFDFYPISSVNTQESATKTDALRIRCVVPPSD